MIYVYVYVYIKVYGIYICIYIYIYTYTHIDIFHIIETIFLHFHINTRDTSRKSTVSIRQPLGVTRRLGSLSLFLPLLLSSPGVPEIPFCFHSPLPKLPHSGQMSRWGPLGTLLGGTRNKEGGGVPRTRGSLSLLMEQHIYKNKSQSGFFTKSRHFTAK